MQANYSNNENKLAFGNSHFSNNEEIKHIAKLFPYSLPIQALLSKNLKNSNKLDFDKFIKISSVISPDRSWLYDYVNNEKSKPIEINKIVEFQEFKNISESKPTISLTNTEILELKNPNTEPEIVSSLVPKTENKIENEVNEDENIVSSVLETVHDKSQNPSSKNDLKPEDKYLDNVLEKEIMKVAIDKTIQKEVDEITASDLITSQISELSKNESTNSLEEKVPEGFNFWLNPSKNKIQSREEKLKKIDALIDKFIKSEPRIVPKKVEFYSPVNVAKQSVEFNEDIISEPLAMIFEKQGYFDQAMRTYEKLSLKFPEKRTYFATRIEKIKEIIKNIKNSK